jgi:preprotein translocase subunit SecG
MILLVRFTLGFMLVFMAFLKIALVLIQRGRGGGLAGAFGGAGGQSAFGTKAGDLFTRITVVAAAIWIILCILATNVLGTKQSRLSPALGAAAGEAVPAETGDGTTADAEATEMEPAESEITEEPETGTEAESAVETEPAAEPAAE